MRRSVTKPAAMNGVKAELPRRSMAATKRASAIRRTFSRSRGGGKRTAVSRSSGRARATADCAMPDLLDVQSILQLVSGLGWTLAYAAILRRAWLDKTPGMPLPALGA